MLKIGNQTHFPLIIGKNNRYLAALFNHLFMQKSILIRLLYLLGLFTFVYNTYAQPSWTINLLDSSKRDKKFEERKLGSEKMADKKFTIVRHIFQNNYTHYNYYYNANNKINTIVERAKTAHKDDYTKLLSYYPYSLENTALQKQELDSVIYKATAGILIHDLRNDWIDNMYLLMGQAYFYRKDFDSAAATFQFINYNLFPRKKAEDDNRIIGTSGASSKGIISIANEEKRNILQKLTALPPSRNDALVWMTLTLIEQNELGEAASLINTLQQDPNLPLRLVNDLEEINAYYFFKQNIYDSAANHLEKALSNYKTKQDLARAEFLLAQLYEGTHQFEKATVYYNKSSDHTTSPVMDIYAQLNNAKMMKGTDVKELDKGIKQLLSMAKKDKFELYRDIIYYAAGELALQKPDTTTGVIYYSKSLQYNQPTSGFKNKAFLKLADIAFDLKQFKRANSLYDSLVLTDTLLNERLPQINERKTALAKIVEKIIIIEREDSLQRIAAMPLLERTAFVKKLSKRLRKENGLKESDNESDNAGPMITFDSKKNEPVDLFNNGSDKGDWYFYNAALKAKGSTDFKSKWGTRNNADNWRRKGAAEKVVKNDVVNAKPESDQGDIDGAVVKNDQKKRIPHGKDKDELKKITLQDVSYLGLMANIPLVPEKLLESNALIAVNLYELAKLIQTELEDYQQAINTYDTSLNRFPDSLYNGGIYLGLYYCYSKLGNTERANYYKNLLNTKFAGSAANKLITNPLSGKPAMKNSAGTKRYEDIYNLFIEGKFKEALSEKQKADSLYGKNFWSPQLLYIESVYFIKEHQDSVAINVLEDIIKLYPKSPLMAKAERMIDVLKRRKEIEEYLTALQVTRMGEDSVVEVPGVKLIRDDANLIVSPKRVDSIKAVIPKNIPKASAIAPEVVVAKDSVKKIIPVVPKNLVKKDTVKNVVPVVPKDLVKKDTIKKIVPVAPKNLVKKDTILKAVPIVPKVVVVKDSVKKAVPVTPKIVVKKDTVKKAVPIITKIEPAKDTIKKTAQILVNASFVFNPAQAQNVVMLLDKVDGTYVNESKNAFTRYISENFKTQKIVISRNALDKDIALLVFTSFANADEAVQFYDKIKKAAPDEVSWLPVAKYSFLVISDDNIQLLQTNKNLKAYKELINKQYPGKF